MVSEKFFDDFLGASLDSASWNAFNSPTVASSEVTMATASLAYITSSGKKTFLVGSEIQVEVYVRDNGGDYDMGLSLTDVSNASNTITFGSTSYSAQGIYSAGGGLFALTQTGVGSGTTAKKYYRLEINGTALKIYFGDNPGNAVLVQSRTLPNSIAGKTFYATLGGGGNPYGGASWDSVRVLTDIVSEQILDIPSVPFIPSVPSVAC